MHDVIIVGAGPSGSHMARCLAGAGLDVLVLEDHDQVGDGVICTGIIGREAYEKFDLPDESVLGFLRKVRFFSPSDKKVDYEPELPLATIVCRKKFDSALARRAEEAGAEVRTGSRVEDIVVGPDSVELVVRSNGDSMRLRSRLCVLATGFGSKLVQGCGFGEPVRLIQGAQVLLPFRDLPDTEIYLGSQFAPKSFGWSVPVGEGQARVGVVTERRAPYYLRQILNRPDVRERIEPNGNQIQACGIPVGALKETVSDRMMVVGEAAGQVKTTTQGGIYYGILCAEAAARVAVDAFGSGNLSKTALAPYELRWRTRLKDELRLGLLLRDFYSELSDRQVDRLFEIARINGVLPLIHRKVHFDWHGPVIRTVLSNGFLGTTVRSALGLGAA